MPYADGKPTKAEQRKAWNDGGRVGPDPWPKATNAAQREVRARLDALNRALKRGRYKPKPMTIAERDERMALATAERMARAERLEIAKAARIQTGPTQRDLAEAWVMAGRIPEQMPEHLKRKRANTEAWQAARRDALALARSVGLAPMPKRKRGGRTRSGSKRAMRTAALVKALDSAV